MAKKQRFSNRTEWYDDAGNKHRDHGPAVEYDDGEKWWFINGFLHREDGPAIESYSTKEWFLNGIAHREDGPAIIHLDGRIEFALNDAYYHDIDEWLIDLDATIEQKTLLKLRYG